MKPKKQDSERRMGPLSLRLSKELTERLERCAQLTGKKKHTLAQEAIEAAIKAVEADGGRLVIPISFKIHLTRTHKAVEVAPDEDLSYPSKNLQASVLNEELVQHEKLKNLKSVINSPSADGSDSSHTPQKAGSAAPQPPTAEPGSKPAIQSDQKKATYRTSSRKRSEDSGKP